MYVLLYLIKIPSFRLSLLEFKKNFPDFDKKKNMNANILNTQISHFNKYELKGH